MATPSIRARGRLRRFIVVADQRGGVAVEFALLAPAFLLTLLSVADVGMMAYYQVRLERAVHEVTRAIRLGPPAMTAEDARQGYCAILANSLIDCEGGAPATLFVEPATNLQDATTRGRGFDRNAIDLGGANSTVVVVGSVVWRPFVPRLSDWFATDDAPPQRLVATHVAKRQFE